MLITFYLALLAKCSSSATRLGAVRFGSDVSFVFAQVRILSRQGGGGGEVEYTHVLPTVWGRLLAATKIRAHTQRLRAEHTHTHV